MDINSYADGMEPSYITVERILERSEYYNNMMESVIHLKEQIENGQGGEIMLKLSDELQSKLAQMKKLKEYTGYIHETLRTLPLHSKRLRQAEEYFYQGKFPEMDRVLDAATIREEIENLMDDCYSKDSERSRKALAGAERRSYELLVKALYGYTFIDNPKWYEDVYSLLSDAHDASFNMHTMYELASYLMDTDEKEWACELLDDAYIMYCKDVEEESCCLYGAKCLWALGVLSRRQGDTVGAIEYIGMALKAYTALSEVNPAEYRPLMADMLEIQGDYHVFSENYPVALIVFEEAMKIRREIASDGNSEYAMYLAHVIDKLATVHLCLEEFSDAISRYEEALKIMDDNIEYNLYDILKSKASTLHNLTLAHFFIDDYQKAVSLAQEELEIRKRVQEIDLFGQLPQRAKTRELLAELYLHLQRPEDAVREREKVVKLYRILSDHFPETYLPDLGEAINLCSNLCIRMKSYRRSFELLQESIEIFGKLSVTKPEDYLLVLGCLWRNVYYYYHKIDPNRKKALEAAQESYRILSSVERDEDSEEVFNDMKRVLGKSME
ncbi:MAG: tetratricopeptide repeat protein [Prevotellaceae bacterium]|jgi:tetratricopeptide (TPR) repeat protein|nr:tetratricopeptide repeat protein [Prevotellaceae bacterium]